MKRARLARRSSSIEALIALALCLAALGAAKPKAEKADQAGIESDARQLAFQNEVLRKRLDLATGESFYFVLEPETRLLRFMYQGNTLKEYRLLDVEVGTRRGFLGSGDPPSGWAARVWEEGELDPARPSQRVELDTADENYEEERQAILVPPTPAEAYPAPDVWHIRYVGGLTLEVHGLADTTRTRPGFLPGLGRWVSDAFQGLVSPGKDTVRIRVYLPREIAGDFYRGVPPTTRFTVLHAS